MLDKNVGEEEFWASPYVKRIRQVSTHYIINLKYTFVIKKNPIIT